jgi:6-phosphogluconolactonase (cycloisomerase 2 family)
MKTNPTQCFSGRPHIASAQFLILAVVTAMGLLPSNARAQIFVANYAGNRISEYTTSGALVNNYLVEGLSNPVGLAVSGSNLYVTNEHNGTIGKYTTSGAVVNAALVTGLSGPRGIAVSGSNLFVVNFNTSTIGVYDATTGAVVNAALITISGVDTGLYGLAVSGSNLYVTDAGAGKVGLYTTSGAVVNAAFITGLSGPRGIVVSGTSLYVTSYYNNTIGEYNATTGAVVNAALVSNLFWASGLAVSGSNLFVTRGSGYNLIGEYTTSGATVNAALATGASGLNEPAGIVVIAETPAAPSFTTQPASQTVTVGANVTFTATASGSPPPTYQWKKGSTDISGATSATLTLNSVTASDAATYTVVATNSVSSVTSNAAVLTVNAAPTQIFVTNYNAGTISEYNLDGSVVNAALVSGLIGPTYLAVSGSHLYVSNFGTGSGAIGRISEYNLDGSVVNVALVSGLQSPYGLAVSGSNLFVVDYVAGTIGEYDATTGAVVNAALVSSLGGQAPAGLAVSGTNLFVVKSAAGTIGEYTTSGATVNAALVSGLGLYGPISVAVSGSHLYVTSKGSGGAGTIGDYDATTGAVVNAALVSGLQYPYGLAVSGSNLFVTEYLAGRIGAYTTSGVTVNTALVSGLDHPFGLAVVVTAPAAPSFTTQPVSQTVTVGANVTFTATASGSPPPTYQWKKGSTDISGATSATLSLTNVQLSDAASYTVVATNSVSSVSSAAAVLTVNTATGFPSFTTQPAGQTVTAGANITLTAAASGSPSPTYQWRKGGVDIAGAIGTTLAFNSATTYDAGTYTVVATNSVGSATSNAATLTVNALDTSGSYLANLSVRVAMAAGQTLIVGFVVDGGAKPILVRAAGPVLNQYGLTGVVDPQLKLFNGSSTQVAANDNWDAALATTFATLGAFPFDTGSKDAALQQTISGPHSAQATATGPGALLVEAYDAGPNDGRKLVNLSTRFQVGTGDNILITGFVLSGTGFKQLLIRAVGPKLTDYGVTGVLADPQVGVFNSSGTQIASNDNWSSTLSATFTALGAFALNPGSKDAALVVTLQAGKLYTVQVSGVGNTTGEALAEIYVLP